MYMIEVCTCFCAMTAMTASNFLHHVLQNELVRHKRDELAVCRFFRADIDARSEDGIDRVDASPVPCDFDGMTDGTFNLARSGCILFPDDGIESLCHIVDDIGIGNSHLDTFAQIAVSFDVRIPVS